MNSLFLTILNNLYILYCKVQILAFQRGNAYLHSSVYTRKNWLKKIREQRAEKWALILTLG